VLGIGYGFRTDLLANIPPFVIAVMLFVPGFTLRPLAMKAGALAVAAAMFAIVASPVVGYVSRMGGCQWHAVLLGLDRSHTETLGVTPSYYQWLTEYADEYMLTAVNSAQSRLGRPAVAYCGPGYDTASGTYLATIASQFPADVVTRAHASILRVIDLPFYLWTDRDPSIQRSAIGELLTFFAGTARVAVVLTVLALGAVSLRWGLFAVFVLTYFGSYPSMQFAPRHFFHLEVFGWWGMAFVAWHSVRLLHAKFTKQDPGWPAEPGRLLMRGLAFGAAVALIMVLPLPLVRAYHDGSVERLTNELLATPRVPILTSRGAEGLDIDIGSAAPDADPTQTVYLDIQLDLSACPAGVPLELRYDASDPFRDFSEPVRPQPPGSVAQRVLVPVHRGFRGLGLAGAPFECVRSVERLQSLDGLFLLPVLTLPENWTSLPKHQTLGQATWRTWGIGG
jgi:hypothetical protein